MDITLDTIKNLSPQRKAIAILIILALLGYFYYFFFLQSAIAKKAALSKQQTKLEQQITEKSRLAAQKDRYLREVALLQENLETVLQKLPNEREIPELFQSVAVSGKNTGVDFILFQPERVTKAKPAPPQRTAKNKKSSAQVSEKEKFYEEIPLKISVSGGFHNIVLFFEKVANLPRIINIEEITMGEGQDVKEKGYIIKTSCLMKTYMFLGNEDEKKK
ncbi:MAG: type 4a pilus biogenesis protein PilO [Deltaproteobacteria bacterium]|nr:type 4a pilus biogenesis protein PilO [Deltaproteobacteria bacterium]